MVNVWHMITGERVMQFAAHRKTVSGQEVDVAISKMQFDPTLRRLITSARDGMVKIWNFNNGALLRVLDQYGDFEVTKSSLVDGTRDWMCTLMIKRKRRHYSGTITTKMTSSL